MDADLVSAVRAEFSTLYDSGLLRERRDGQLEMALAVARAIADGRHLAVQAGTGVGKTSAYLIPAILSGHRVVVSTSTKSLQEQISGRDLPTLREALGRDFTWAVVKGRSNYLCRQRLVETAADTARPPAAHRRLTEWAAITATGDRDELATAPTDAAWRRVSVRSDECPGRDRCPSADGCFAERARSVAADADVIVTNHHVYAASLIASRHLLPEHRIVVFDEAHQVAQAVRQTTSTRVDPVRIARIAGADAAWDALRETLAPHAGRHLPGLPAPVAEALDAAGEVLRLTATRARAAARNGSPDGPDGPDGPSVSGGQRRAHTLGLLAENVALSRSGEDRPMWVEGTADEPVLRSFAAGAGMRSAVGDAAARTVIMTSATLGDDPVRELGLADDAVHGLTVPSPYAYDEQAVFYCAADLPDPRNPAWPAAAHAQLATLVNAAGGRTLALFTSWKALHAAVASVSPHIDAEILVQGTLGKRELLDRFRKETTSCLFGTVGLAQGTDIPGDALALVTIDRLPFPPAHDPYVAAQRAAAGPHAFEAVDLRHARVALAQVAGRLIRTREDRGVFAVLDPRLAQAAYRWVLVRAVPPMRRTRDLATVCAFLRNCAETAAATSGDGSARAPLVGAAGPPE